MLAIKQGNYKRHVDLKSVYINANQPFDLFLKHDISIRIAWISFT